MGLVVSLVRRGRLFPQGTSRERRGQGPLFPWFFRCSAERCFKVVERCSTPRKPFEKGLTENFYAASRLQTFHQLLQGFFTHVVRPRQGKGDAHALVLLHAQVVEGQPLDLLQIGKAFG